MTTDVDTYKTYNNRMHIRLFVFFLLYTHALNTTGQSLWYHKTKPNQNQVFSLFLPLLQCGDLFSHTRLAMTVWLIDWFKIGNIFMRILKMTSISYFRKFEPFWATEQKWLFRNEQWRTKILFEQYRPIWFKCWLMKSCGFYVRRMCVFFQTTIHDAV